MSYLIDDISDIRERPKVEGMIDPDDQEAALMCFVYLYTGEYTYSKINAQLNQGYYEKIAKVLAVVQMQLRSYQSADFSRRLRPNNGRIVDLYRGV